MKPTSAMNTRTGVTDFAHQRPVLVAKDKTLTRTGQSRFALRSVVQRLPTHSLVAGADCNSSLRAAWCVRRWRSDDACRLR
jgi:hypothetical protein